MDRFSKKNKFIKHSANDISIEYQVPSNPGEIVRDTSP